MPDLVYGGSYAWRTNDLSGFWQLTYPHATLNLKNIRPDTIKVDWIFVIGYVLSLVAILFTFDSISGERAHGTLRLTLANPVPRHTVLIGKFLGALVSISVPFTLAVLINLLVISTSSDVQLGTDACESFRHYFCYCASVPVSVSCVRFVSIVAGTAKCGKSCDTPFYVGLLCGFYAEYTCFHCERIVNLDDL